MSWFNTEGANPERILFSRARYQRHPERLAFGLSANDKRLSDICQKIDKLLLQNGFRAESSENAAALAEKQLISPEIAQYGGARAVYFNEPCSLSVTVGGSELISIQSVMSGRSITEARGAAAKVEELLDGELGFAYNERLGYLCARPEECGSALELCACIYLPSLRLLGGYEQLCSTLMRRGAQLFPLLDSKDNAGDLYLLCLRPPHLADEQQCVMNFDTLMGELDRLEEKRCKMLYPTDNAEVSERAHRAVGALKYARNMSQDEMLCLISDIRLSLTLGACEKDALPSLCDLNYMCAEGFDLCLIASSKQRCTCFADVHRLRAEFLSKYISGRVS